MAEGQSRNLRLEEIDVVIGQVSKAFDSFPPGVPSSRLVLVLDVLNLVAGRHSSLEIKDESGRSVRLEGRVSRVVSSTKLTAEMSRSVDKPTGRLDSKE